MQHNRNRTVPVAIRSVAGWVTGRLHFEAETSMLRHLNESGAFFRLTDVMLPGEKRLRDFFAIHAREAAFVVPLSCEEEKHASEYAAESRRHEVACLLPEGPLFCSFDVLAGIRVSDYLMNHTQFIPVRRCWTPFRELPGTLSEPIEFGFLNSSRIVGVSEAGVRSGHESRLAGVIA
ncbi:MAG: hypothetical protein HYU52_05965 [Acidobacteria bacterium]|nr:hypothetical protein [Acidobacteriota bacterium]